MFSPYLTIFRAVFHYSLLRFVNALRLLTVMDYGGNLLFAILRQSSIHIVFKNFTAYQNIYFLLLHFIIGFPMTLS